jgi:hypothetical protein
VSELLTASPRLRLDEVAARLGMERHTVTRALAASGRRFRTLQTDATLAALRRLAAQDPPRSAKLLAIELGFSSRVAFAHFLRRHGGAAAPKWQQVFPDVILTPGDPD